MTDNERAARLIAAFDEQALAPASAVDHPKMVEMAAQAILAANADVNARLQGLLERIDAVFDAAVKFHWRITTDATAQRFRALQEAAEAARKALDGENPPLEGPGLRCICRDCGKEFRLTGDDSEREDAYTFVEVSSCDSGGVYDMVVRCPHCGHRHDMM